MEKDADWPGMPVGGGIAEAEGSLRQWRWSSCSHPWYCGHSSQPFQWRPPHEQPCARATSTSEQPCALESGPLGGGEGLTSVTPTAVAAVLECSSGDVATASNLWCCLLQVSSSAVSYQSPSLPSAVVVLLWLDSVPPWQTGASCTWTGQCAAACPSGWELLSFVERALESGPVSVAQGDRNWMPTVKERTHLAMVMGLTASPGGTVQPPHLSLRSGLVQGQH